MGPTLFFLCIHALNFEVSIYFFFFFEKKVNIRVVYILCVSHCRVGTAKIKRKKKVLDIFFFCWYWKAYPRVQTTVNLCFQFLGLKEQFTPQTNIFLRKNYRLCVIYVPPPRIQIEVFRTGQFFIISSPYMITEICKIRFFVTFCVINLPWYTHSSLPRYRVFQFCLDIHSLNENDIKKWWSMYLFRPVPKNFSGRVNPFEFEGGK